MQTGADQDDTLYVGIDGGGSRCRALIVQGAQVLGQGEGGPANPYHGLERAVGSILAAVDAALTEAGLPAAAKSELVAGMGLAGVNVARVYQQMQEAKLPFRHSYLTTDLHIACMGAHGQEEGAVIVAGTGTCGFARVGGQSFMLGGHGFPLGDIGGGAWLGLEAVKAVLLAVDGLGPATGLSEYLKEQLQAEGLQLVERLQNAKSSDYARLAPAVFHAAEQGDGVARSIVTRGADYLNGLARQLWQLGPPRMTMIGGVSEQIGQWMDQALMARLSAPLQAPVYGALHFARAEWLQRSRHNLRDTPCGDPSAP